MRHVFEIINSQGRMTGRLTVVASEEELGATLSAQLPKLEVLSLPNSNNWELQSRRGRHLGVLRHVLTEET